MKKELINFVDISKSFENNMILDEFNLYIRENEFLTLLGPSGCGKTTTLRILGGFETPDKGQILFDGKDITNIPANERNLNTVFQKYSLFPHMSIAENIAFGLKIKKKSKAYIDDKIKYALKLVNLDGFEHRSVDSLSGGQQQRIAIARAIVNEPKVLLLDEPLGALDLKLRQNMQYELIRLKEELGITFVYVTHDQEEALTMSDTIVVMNQGYIQQIGTPEDIYNEPENAFVADFIGHSNIIDGIMVQDRLVEILGTKIPCVDEGFGENTPVDVVIRPEDVELVKPEDGLLVARAEKKTAAYPDTDLSLFYNSLPFTLTGAQRRAVEEILRDFRKGAPMNRLVQGDVGSGKTMVAAAAAYCAARNGKQSALMEVDVFLNGKPQRLLVLKGFQIVHFGFNDSPEPLSWAIINAMRNAGHGLIHTLFLHLGLEVRTGILEPPVRVEYRLCVRIAGNRFVKGLENQSIVITSAQHEGDN